MASKVVEEIRKIGHVIALIGTATRAGCTSCEMVVAKQTANGLAYAIGNRRVCEAFHFAQLAKKVTPERP